MGRKTGKRMFDMGKGREVVCTVCDSRLGVCVIVEGGGRMHEKAAFGVFDIDIDMDMDMDMG